MAKTLYAFRLRRRIPLLDEQEWAEIKPLLHGRAQAFIDYRKATGCSLQEAYAVDPVGRRALERYKEMTGVMLSDAGELWAVRRADYGSICPECDRPFRTPRAKFRAECGFTPPSDATP